ncbi:MAG: zinc-binding dehydrogenase [Anaerolineales bacterium]|jgi:propanol-preferring alcohol dehydrogenase
MNGEMWGVHFLGRGRISLDRMPIPEPKDQDVLVQIKVAGICGTDRENLLGSGQTVVPGHENAGVVAATDKALRLKVGDRVGINCHITCRRCEYCLRGDLYFCPELKVVGFDIDGGFAEYALIPEPCCMFLPADISFDAGSLLMDVFGTAYRGVKQGRPLPGDQVAVWGAGPIGLAAMLTAKHLGAQVASIDFNQHRLETARNLGAQLVLNPGREDVVAALMEWTAGRGLDIAYECVGNEQAALQALSALRKRGRLGVIGVSDHLTINPWEQLIRRELSLYGSRNFTLPEFDEMVSIVRHGLPVEKIISHRFPMDQAADAFEVFRSGECEKVTLVA